MMKIFTYFVITVLVMLLFPFFLTGMLLLLAGALLKSLGYLLLFERVYAVRELTETADYLWNCSTWKED